MRKGQQIEKCYPVIVSALLGIGYYAYSGSVGEPVLDVDKRQSFLSMVIDVGAIAVGFLGALMGIILTLDEKPAIRHLRSSGTHDNLIDYLGWAALSCLALVVYSLSIVGGTIASIKLAPYPYVHIAASALWIFTATFSVLSSLRCLIFFWHVLKFREEETAPKLGSDPTK